MKDKTNEAKAAETKDADERYYCPEMFIAEFNRILQEKRSAGEILTEKPTPEQAKAIVMQIFDHGMKRPARKEDAERE